MICLSLEGTSHTFGIGIVTKEGKILANERDVYSPPIGKGIIPAEAALHHEKVKEKVLENSLKRAGMTLGKIDLIAYSAGPGLPLPLIKTENYAIELSKKLKKPLIKVNHPVAHLEIGKLTTKAKDPIYVYLSGGNTQIIGFTEARYRIFGETLDIPVGNCLDVVARKMNLPMPGGFEIERLARTGTYLELPYTIKGMDLSFAGIQTAAIKSFEMGGSKEDVAFSLQETCFAMLSEVTERALAHTGKEEVLLVGGVAANKRLQEMMKEMCSERGAEFFVVPAEYSGDQGAMIGWTGILAYNSGWRADFKDKINPKWRIDQVEVTWV